jgi:hypothetical protein
MSANPVRKVLVTGLLVWCCAVPARGELVKWIDERGTVHFADSVSEVPAAYRSQLGAASGDSVGSKSLQILGFEERRREKATAAGPGQQAAVAWELPWGPAPGGLELPTFTIEQLLLLLLAQFFVSMVVLTICVAMIGEKAEHLVLKVLGSVFAQRFLMFAAFLLLSSSIAGSLVPDAATVPELAKASLKMIGAEIGIMALILRFTICSEFARAMLLSVIFCTIDAVAEGSVFFGALTLFG